MEGSAANAKKIKGKYVLPNSGDQQHEYMVIASGEFVSIGTVTFKRDDLLLAMGVTQADIDRLKLGESTKVDFIEQQRLDAEKPGPQDGGS